MHIHSRVNEISKILKSEDLLECPTCDNQLFILGKTMQILWCHNCKTMYTLMLRRNNILGEDELKNMLGFPTKADLTKRVTRHKW